MYFQAKKRKIMNDVDLKRRAAELEQSLQLQLQTIKKDSQVWLVGGGAALLAGIIAFSVTKKKRKKKKRLKSDAKHAAATFEARTTSRPSRKASFFSSLKKRLFLTLLSYGQAKFIEELNKRKRRTA